VVTPPSPNITKGSTATFRLRLLSAATGTVTGQLRINNNDPNDNPYTVSLTGSVSPVLQCLLQGYDRLLEGCQTGRHLIDTVAQPGFEAERGLATSTISGFDFLWQRSFPIWNEPFV
jgi:hypothetical protein